MKNYTLLVLCGLIYMVLAFNFYNINGFLIINNFLASNNMTNKTSMLHKYSTVNNFKNNSSGNTKISQTMPRSSSVSVEEIVELIKKYIVYFNTPILPRYNSDVYHKISNDLMGKWNAHCVYVNLKNDRRCILSKARAEIGIDVDANNNYSVHTSNDTTDSNNSLLSLLEINEDENINSSLSFNEVERKLEDFDLILSEEDWKDIKPNSVLYGNRSKLTLKKCSWTNVISLSFWKQYRFPCAFVFKRADVTSNELKIYGKCKSKKCGNIFKGHANLLEQDEKMFKIKVKTKDTRFQPHENVKRPLNYKVRKYVQKKLVTEGCSAYMKRKARLTMKAGDTEPPFLPSGDVLRQAKKEFLNRDLNVRPDDSRDLIRTIEEISETSEYYGLICAVGSKPFYVFYGTPAQLYAYKEYCRLTKYCSKISIDATGSLIKKLTRPNSIKSGHIFLYAIVINFEKSTLLVNQMLTEKHETEFIEYWLRQWLRAGAPKPQQVVCDYSRALLSAISMSFNNQTLKSYLNDFFLIVYKSPNINVNFPGVRIRVDISHFVKIICRWKCFKFVRQIYIKEFFIRCICLMIKCHTLSEFENIFLLTYCVASQTHDDNIINISYVSNAKNARKKLENCIATQSFNIDTLIKENIDLITEKVDDFNSLNDDVDGDKVDYDIHKWIQENVLKFEQTIYKGDELNPFYLPELANQLKQISYEFLLWSNVGLPLNASNATSSDVEGYFNELKTRVLRNHKPLRIDKFLKLHLRDIIGGTLLFSSKMINLCDNFIQNIPKNGIYDSNNNFEMDHGDLQIQNESAVSKQIEKVSSDSMDTSGLKQVDNLVANLLMNDSVSKVDNNIAANSINDFELVESFVLNSMNDYLDSKRSFVPIDVEHVEDARPMWSIINDSDLMTVENWRAKAETENYNFLNQNQLNLEENFEVNILPNKDSSVKSKLEIDYNPVKNSMDVFDLNTLDSLKVKEETDDGKFVSSTSKKKIVNNANLQIESNKIAIIKNNELSQQTQIKANRNKYLKPFPQIRHVNKIGKKKSKSALLPNGSVCRFPIKIQNVNYFVRSTCGFDSIVHILMTAALDNQSFYSVIENSSNSTFQIVKKLIKVGGSKEILSDRASILKDISELRKISQADNRILSYWVDATDNIVNILNKTLKSEPAVRETETCSVCNGSTRVYTSLSPNFNVIKNKGFSCLQEALNFQTSVEFLNCKNKCPGKCILQKTLHSYICIDLDIRETITSTNGMKCALKDIPKDIVLDAINQPSIFYSLSGVVAYNSNHFVSYCLRYTGLWEMYNDLLKEVRSCNEKTFIEPHLLIYTRL